MAACSTSWLAVAGRPAPKGGAGAYSNWSWMVSCFLLPGQFGDQGQGEIDPGGDAAAGDEIAVPYHARLHRDGAEGRQQIMRGPNGCVARLPCSRPAAPRTSAPVQTEVT